MRNFNSVELTVEDKNLVEKLKVVEDPGKINCRMLQSVWSKIEKDKKFLNNCFCSSSTRKSFKKMFYDMFSEYETYKNGEK